MAALAFAQGFALSLGMIVAIGPQNLHVLATGLRRQHVHATVALCVGADVVLIALGALGLGGGLAAMPLLAAALQWIAAAFLGICAWRAWCDARRTAALSVGPARGPESGAPERGRVVATTLVVTFANPSVYLETLLLLGSASAGFDGPARAAFAGGAIGASALWFGTLGWGARYLAPWLARPRAWQLLQGASAVVMFNLALGLVVQLAHDAGAGAALMATLRVPAG